MSSDKRAAWGGRLFLAPGLFLYVGAGASADNHAHHAVQFVWSNTGPVTLRLAAQIVRANAFLVPASVDHSFDAAGQQIALLLMERHGARGAALDRVAREHVGKELSSRLVDIPFPSAELGTQGAVAWCDAVLTALGFASLANEPSSVSRRVVEYVESHLDGVPRLA